MLFSKYHGDINFFTFKGLSESQNPIVPTMMIVILIITLVVLVVFIIWNMISYRAIKKNNKNTEKLLDDPKYYELKYKMEFLIAAFSVIVALAGLLGYNSFQTAKDEIKAELGKKVSFLEDQLKGIENNLVKNDSLINILKFRTDDVKTNLSSSDKEISRQLSDLKSLENKIDIINDKNIIKQNFYIVSSMGYKYISEEYTLTRFYFKDLTTISGDRLPQFNSPPLVIPVPESAVLVDVLNITNDSFQVGVTVSYIDVIDSVKFSAVIIEK